MTSPLHPALKIAINTILVVITLIVVFYIFRVFYDFYSSQEFVGSHNIPTDNGFRILAGLLWFPIIAIAMFVGSLLRKWWAWYLIFFVAVYSVFFVVYYLVFNPEDKLINYLKLFAYFAFIALLISQKMTNYYGVQVHKRIYYIMPAGAALAFAISV